MEQSSLEDKIVQMEFLVLENQAKEMGRQDREHLVKKLQMIMNV